jgi:hypothetical protein
VDSSLNANFRNLFAAPRPIRRSRRGENATAFDSSSISKAYAFLFLKNEIRAMVAH